MESIDAVLGFLMGAVVMWTVAWTTIREWKRDLDKLKDFDTWKEWRKTGKIN